MSELLFYHLTESKLEDALPPLLDKSLERGWRVVVQTGDAERRDALDTHLWTFREDSFLPHGLAEEPLAERQPVLLSTALDNPNGGDALFLLDGAEPGDLSDFARCILLFDGRDEEALRLARGRWKAFKAAGHPVSYWQQAERGWEKKA